MFQSSLLFCWLWFWRAFEDDNLAVIEQSPNASDTRADAPTHASDAHSTTALMMMKPICTVIDEVSAHKDLPVIVETHQNHQESVSKDPVGHENNLTN